MPSAKLSTEKMFILTRHGFDNGQDGVTFVYWAKANEQAVKLVFTAQRPVIFIAKSHILDANILALVQERKPLSMHGMNWIEQNIPVDALYFSSLRHYNEFKNIASANNIELFESDISPQERFLMERFIFGSCEVKGNRVDKQSYIQFINPEIKGEDFQPDLVSASIDIETNEFASAIYSIAIDSRDKKIVWVVDADVSATKSSKAFSSDYVLHYVKDEKTLLLALLKAIYLIDPDVIIGWNVVGFDLRIIDKKCHEHGLPFRLGRGERKSILLPARNNEFNAMPRLLIDGRVVVDGIEALRSAFYQFESFALDNVAHELLGKRKEINAGNDKMAEINRMYSYDKAALAHYNFVDTQLVSEIFTATKMMDFLIEKTKMTGLAFGRLGGSVAAFDYIYLPKLHRKNMVAQNVGANVFDTSSPGGYVLASLPGMYANVAVLDFKSLYPSIIRTFYVDPYGLYQSTHEQDVVAGYEQAQFIKEGAILPDIIDQLWKMRDNAKRDNNQPLSQAIKIIMNSFYGVLGTPQCRFYHPKLASSITKRGHEIILKTKKYIEQQGWNVIYGDTDSLFIHFGDDKTYQQSHTFALDLMLSINTWWQATLQDEMGITSHLEMEFETLFEKFYMPTIRGSDSGSKKRYAGWVRQDAEDDNIEHGKLVIKGLEAVRTDWVLLAKQMQVALLTQVFTNKPYKQEIKMNILQMQEKQLDDKLIFRKRLRKPVADYVKNVPPHAQAAKKMQITKDNPYYKGSVKYVITPMGAEPIENEPEDLDYDYYLENQIQPALESILQAVGEDFDSLISNQQSLF